MLRKLLPRRGSGGPPGGAEAGSREEAEAALAAWEAALGSGEEAGSELLERALSAVLAVPIEAREPLEGALRRLAERFPAARAAPAGEGAAGAQDPPQAVLSILKISRSESAELASALAAVLLAARRSEALEGRVAEAASCAAARDDAAACPTVRLAAALQGGRALSEARGLCEGALRSREESLEAAAASLEAPRLAAQRQREEAALRRAEHEKELEALNTPAQGSPAAAADPGTALEAEVERLSALRQQLLAELDEVSTRHGDAAARQRAHMTQVDGWRLDRERAHTATRGAEKQVCAELGSLERRAEACDALAARLREVVEVQRGALDEHAPALGGARDDVCSSAAAVLAESEARLDAALVRARGRQAEHRRARQRLELLEVGGSQADLPTRAPLEAALSALRDAWAARAALGGVELQRRFEVEALIQEAQADAGCAETAEPLADLKAAWAQHWAELGDAGAALAEAAGGAGVAMAEGVGAGLPGPAAAGGAKGAAARPPHGGGLPALDDDEPLLA